MVALVRLFVLLPWLPCVTTLSSNSPELLGLHQLLLWVLLNGALPILMPDVARIHAFLLL